MSSEPVSGCGIGATPSSPDTARATSRANAVSALSFTVTGYSSCRTTSARTPCASAIRRQSSGASAAMRSRLAWEKVRTVASNRASSAMTLRRVPARTVPTVITTGSKTSNRRVTSVCRAVIISAAAVTGSRARCGVDPWPPAPRTVTSSPPLAAIRVPGRLTNTPLG